MKIIFGTVIYSQAAYFWPDLKRSIAGQTCQNFDTLLVNDNYPPIALIALGISTMERVHFVDKYADKLTPGQLRIELIREAKDAGADLLIVADADDTFSRTRVESYMAAYEKDSSFAFYYNDLMTEPGPDAESLPILTDMPVQIDSVRDISQSNFLGMSTTAINLNALSYDFIDSLREGDTRVFDWYLFSRILLDVGPGCHVSNADTYYRIHGNNIVGTSHDLEQEIAVKLAHYKNLSKKYPYFGHLYEDLKTLNLNKADIAPQGRGGRWWSSIIMEDHYEI